jgi:hypothetical protein
MNGAQISSLVDVIKAAGAKEISRESAAAILTLAFAGVTPADAERLLGPAGFEPVPPEPKPGPFGGGPRGGSSSTGGDGGSPAASPPNAQGARGDYSPDQPRAENGQFGEGGDAGDDGEAWHEGPRFERMSLQDFAADVKARAASAQGHGQAGTPYHKAFVSSTFVAMGRGRGSLETFKARLLEAHKKGLLELARADMPAAMPAHHVANSEITHGEASFHLIRHDRHDGDGVRLDFVEQRGEHWVVLDHTRTKVLGTYETEADARARLAQIEAFKARE